MPSLPGGIAAVLLALGCSAACGQQPVTDPAPFRRPLVFVPPDAPAAALAAQSPLKYTIDVAIDTDGLVAGITRLEPDHAEFREHLAKVTKHWLFYPSLDPDSCETLAGTARVNVEFARGETGVRSWLQYDPMQEVMAGEAPKILQQPDLPLYPLREQREGKQATLYTVSAIDAQGKVTMAWTLLGKAYSRGFVNTASAHALAMRYEPSTRARRCVMTQYRFTLD